MSGRDRTGRGRSAQPAALLPTQPEESAGDSVSSPHRRSPDPLGVQEQEAAPPDQPAVDGEADMILQTMLGVLQTYAHRRQAAAAPTQSAAHSRAGMAPPPPPPPVAPPPPVVLPIVPAGVAIPVAPPPPPVVQQTLPAGVAIPAT